MGRITYNDDYKNYSLILVYIHDIRVSAESKDERYKMILSFRNRMLKRTCCFHINWNRRFIRVCRSVTSAGSAIFIILLKSLPAKSTKPWLRSVQNFLFILSLSQHKLLMLKPYFLDLNTNNMCWSNRIC
jgi:hypothetical protein